MIAPLVIFPAIVAALPAGEPDLVFHGLTEFSTTEVEIVSKTGAGRSFIEGLFGVGCVAVTLRKSAAGEFTDRATKAGLRWEGQ